MKTRTVEQNYQYYDGLRPLTSNNLAQSKLAEKLKIPRRALRRVRTNIKTSEFNKRKPRKDKVGLMAANFLDEWWHEQGSRYNTDASRKKKVAKGVYHQPQIRMDTYKNLYKEFKVYKY
jgi:hypothetical protein